MHIPAPNPNLFASESNTSIQFIQLYLAWLLRPGLEPAACKHVVPTYLVLDQFLYKFLGVD
jgi:hypothetical protein